MKRKSIILLVFLITAILLTVLAIWLTGWLAIDKCLDNGGRWNYGQNICEYAEK